MSQAAKDIIDRISAAFWTGSFDTIVDLFAPSIAIYRQQEILNTLSCQDILAAMSAIRLEYLSAGVCSQRGELVAVGLPRNGQIRIMADFLFCTGETAEPHRSCVTFYCRQTSSTPTAPTPLLIEMVEYRKEAVPLDQVAQAIADGPGNRTRRTAG